MGKCEVVKCSPRERGGDSAKYMSDFDDLIGVVSKGRGGNMVHIGKHMPDEETVIVAEAASKERHSLSPKTMMKIDAKKYTSYKKEIDRIKIGDANPKVEAPCKKPASRHLYADTPLNGGIAQPERNVNEKKTKDRKTPLSSGSNCPRWLTQPILCSIYHKGKLVST